MSSTADQKAFMKGMMALTDGRPGDALAYFESALRLESQRGAAGRQMRYLSYYGLATAMADRATPEAVQACEVAARRDFCSPELQLNLGKVYMLAGKTTRALAAFERGLKLAPADKSLQCELGTAERRRPPAIPWLSRKHPLNCWLGRMRSSLASRARTRPVS